jgi:hypothetical protein
MQPLASFEFLKSRSDFLAHSAPRRIGQRQVDLRD